VVEKVANLAVALRLDSANFESSATKAQRTIQQSLQGMDQKLAQTGQAFAKFSGQQRAALSNVASQVQDVAVQLAAGTSKLQVLIQQGPQIASAFGPAGAAIGAVGAVLAAAAGAALGFGNAAAASAKKAEDKFDAAAAAVRRLEGDINRAKEAQTALLRQQIDGGPTFTGGKLVEPTLDELEGRLGQVAKLRERERILREAIERDALDNDSFRPSARDAAGGRAIAERNRLAAERQEREKAAESAARAAEMAERRRVAAAQRASDALRRLEQERADDAAESIRQEVSGFEKAMEEKRRSAEEFNRFLLGIERDIADNRAREAKAELERQSAILTDVLVQPFRDLASQVSQIATDLFADFLEKGSISGKKLFDGLADTARTATAGLLGNLLTLPINTAISQIATEAIKPGGSLTGSVTEFAKANPYLAAGIGGAVVGGTVGSLYSNIAGLKPGNQANLGGTIGGAGGAIIGYAVGGLPGALIGGAVGSVGGSVIGGLFGGENNLGNDRSAQTFNTRKGEIVYSDRSFSPENRNITAGILGEVQTLQEALSGLGAAFDNFNLRIEAGNKTGITVNGKQYKTAQEALEAALQELIGGTSGLTATQGTILANSKARSAQEINSDLAFGDVYDRLVGSGDELDQQLSDLNRTFTDASRRAAKLGLDTNALAEAHRKAADEAIRQFQVEQRSLVFRLRQVGGDQSLGLQLEILNAEMQAFAEEAERLRLPLELVTDAHRKAAQQLVEDHARLVESTRQNAINLGRQLDATVRSAASFYDDLIRPLQDAVANDNASPIGQVAQERQRFFDLLGLAQGGDADATRELAGSASTLQGLLRQFGGSGA
jgi:hypothetical protein